jgi:hypothetical protein
MFHKMLEIGKERMLDGLFQKVSCVDFCSICSIIWWKSVPSAWHRVDSFQARAALTNRNSRVSKSEGAEL